MSECLKQQQSAWSRHRLETPDRFDDLSLLGLILWTLWILIASASVQRGDWRQLLWLCDVGTLASAIALLAHNRILLTAQITGILVYHLGWHLDLLSYLIIGNMPFHATAYMFSGDFSPYEKALSFFQHTFVVPACAWGLLRLGVSSRGWLLQWLQTMAVISLTYLLTRPSENINWIFGAGFPALSPVGANPRLFYVLMCFLVPVAFYWPANCLVSILSHKYHVPSCDGLSYLRVKLLSVAIVGVGVAVFVGYSWHPPSSFPKSLLTSSLAKRTVLEMLPDERRAPSVQSISYGLSNHEQTIPLRIIRDTLPRSHAQDEQPGSLLLSGLFDLRSMDLYPWAPQEVIVRGRRGLKGTVVCAVVGADRFYPQPDCDTQTALDTFQVYAHLGLEGLAEFALPGTNERKTAATNQVIAGGPLRSLFVLTVVAFDRTSTLRSPFYIVQRTGIWCSDDLKWTNTNNHWLVAIR